MCGEWKYPLDDITLRKFIKSYLDRTGKKVRVFLNHENLPGPEFVYSFLKRHKDELSARMCQNIKRSRAAVSREVCQEYFEDIKEWVVDVPLSNIVNYDETNLTDDPKRKKVIVKRGCKYPERVMNSSKSATSIMMAGAADGTMLPVYIVYKAKHLYDTWRENGPKGARYNRTLSGWFDSNCFDDWIKTIVLPYFKKLEGKKVIIGDNLSSHLSPEGVRLLHENNITMKFLPANSTHLTQVLDVAFFRPMKINWASILTTWKLGPGKKELSVPKESFPNLLKQLVTKMEEKGSENIKSGFRKCGIVPFNPYEVLKRIPDKSELPVAAEKISKDVDGSLIDLLSELKNCPAGGPAVRKPKKRLKVAQGASVGGDLSEEENDQQDGWEENYDERYLSDDEDEYRYMVPEDDNEPSSAAVPAGEENAIESEGLHPVTDESTEECALEPPAPETFEPYSINVGDFLIVGFQTNKRDRRFIAKVLSTSTENNDIEVKFLRKKVGRKNTFFVFPEIDDISSITPSQIERKITPMNSRRGQYTFIVNATHLE